MTHGTLDWAKDSDGFLFTCHDGGDGIPFDDWGTRSLLAASGSPVSLAPLFRVVDEGLARVESNRVWLPDGVVAKMRDAELRGLGLPPAAPFTLRLDKSGLLTDPSFEVMAALIRPGGQPVVGPDIDGALLRVGGRAYLLTDPVYSALRAIRGLSAASTMEARAPWLADLQESLPSDALADDYLKFIHVAVADRFTVLPRLNDRGEVDFDLRPAREETVDDGEPSVSAALPEARETEWNRQVRSSSDVRGAYALRDGHYVCLTSELREALRVAKRLQQAPPSQRAAFVRAPRAFLREHLAESASEPALENLFWESGEYSTRVRAVGAWKAKVLPFVQQSGIEWMPPEEMGLRVGDALVKLKLQELEPLLQRLRKAQAAGEPAVLVGDHLVPATEESISAVEELLHAATPPATRGSRDIEEVQRIAVVIDDNLESADFTREATGRPGVVGTLPSTLATSLYSFQREGLEWLQRLWTSGASGGLLADDMGLGKTVQTLGFLAWVRAIQDDVPRERGPILIVGPTGLLRNWQAEHDHHLRDGGLGQRFEAHGRGLADLRMTGARGAELETGIPTLDIERLATHDCVLTTYETLRDYQHSFGRIKWTVAVLDEAQKIKNPAALMTEAVKAINARFTIALTGTPVENHLSDLWCVTDTVQPGRLGALKDFVAHYVPGGQLSPDRVRELKHILTEHAPPPMLRRLKTEHLKGLPTIERHVVKSVMPDVQAEAYDEVVRLARGATGMSGMLKVLQHLRAVSLHPKQEFDGDHKAFVGASARLRDTIQILDAIASRGEKALVFVEAIAMQGVLAELLQRRFGLASPPLIVNGGVEGSRRKDRVDQFQSRSGFDVMLLSPRAAGVGLTIVEANHVIHLSRWWNPAVEDQATDRVYRIGQTRPVHVYTPLAIHPRLQDASFDVRLHELITNKRHLSQSVLAPAGASEGELASLYQASLGSD